MGTRVVGLSCLRSLRVPSGAEDRGFSSGLLKNPLLGESLRNVGGYEWQAGHSTEGRLRLQRAGVGYFAGGAGKAKRPPSQVAHELFPELSGYQWPLGGARGELRSLQYHASLHKGSQEPAKAEKQEVLRKVLRHYPRAAPPQAFRYTEEGGLASAGEETFTPEGDRELLLALSEEALEKRLRVRDIMSTEVVQDSSPGVPYARFGKTNKDLMKDEFAVSFVVSVVLRRFKLLLQTSPSETENFTASQLVQKGLCDPVKVFIKGEPHKLEKIQAGKLRIISNVSLADQIIERILFTRQNKLEIAEWTKCPSKPGMGLDDSGLQQLFAEVSSRWQAGRRTAESDVSGWDWSVTDWMLRWDAEARIALAGATPQSPFGRVVLNRVACLSKTVFYLSDGQMWEQLDAGIQLSGSFNTSSTNSRARVMLGWIEGVEWLIAMGDDDVEDETPGRVPDYARHGFPVKDYKIVGEDRHFEFCSTVFPGNWKGYPARPARLLYRYLSNSPSVRQQRPELRAQLAMELRYLPGKDEVLSRLDSIAELESKPCQQ